MKDALETLLRRKTARSVPMTLRVPRALRERIEDLRAQAEAVGYEIDLTCAIDQYLDRVAAALAGRNKVDANPASSAHRSADRSSDPGR